MPNTQTNWLTRTLTNHATVKAYMEPVVQLFKPQWQAAGFRARVEKKRTENQQTFSLVLKPQSKWPMFLAGQYTTISVEINGTRYHRTFSISSSPSYYQKTGLIELTIRQQDGGKVTPYLAQYITKGKQLVISAAEGEFTIPDQQASLLLIAGGSGITPFRSFIHECATKRPTQDIHLVYYHNTKKPLFPDEWSQLTELMPNLKVSLINTRVSGHINKAQLLNTCSDVNHRVAFLCGPHGLHVTGKEILTTLGLSNDSIKQELFGPKPISDLTFDDAEVYFSQSNISAQVGKDHPKTLLELAEDARINPSNGCRMGVCHQCKCRKKQGIVYNTRTEQFSDTGEEDIQLCISMAVGQVNLDL